MLIYYMHIISVLKTKLASNSQWKYLLYLLNTTDKREHIFPYLRKEPHWKICFVSIYSLASILYLRLESRRYIHTSIRVSLTSQGAGLLSSFLYIGSHMQGLFKFLKLMNCPHFNTTKKIFGSGRSQRVIRSHFRKLVRTSSEDPLNFWKHVDRSRLIKHSMHNLENVWNFGRNGSITTVNYEQRILRILISKKNTLKSFF